MWLLMLAAQCIVATWCCDCLPATVLFLALVLDPAAQLFHVRVHAKELVPRACLCMIHLRRRTADFDAGIMQKYNDGVDLWLAMSRQAV